MKLTFADGNALSCVDSDAPEETIDNNGMAEMQERMQQSSDMNKLVPLDTIGYSLGGKMRSQPSKDYNSVAKIRRGNRLQIIGRTAMSDGGYTWYKVKTGGGKTGFMWGGELCYAYERQAGLYGSCRTQGIEVVNKWMVIAVNTQKDAGALALTLTVTEPSNKPCVIVAIIAKLLMKANRSAMLMRPAVKPDISTEAPKEARY